MSSADVLAQVQADVKRAEGAKDTFQEGMEAFQAACIIGAWDRTECARARIHDAVDAYCDNLAAAHKAISRG